MPFLKAAALSAAIAVALTGPALAQASSTQSVVVLPFAVAGHDDPLGACLPAAEGAAGPLDVASGSDLPSKLSAAVARQLHAAQGPRTDLETLGAPLGGLVVAGCIERADPGNAAERLIGMNMGASVLTAHVRLFRDGQLVREFDAQVWGANTLPPIGPVGLAVHGVKGLHETLAADAMKLSKQIADQVTVD